MKKIIRLTESDLVRLVKKVIKEQENPSLSEFISKGYKDITSEFSTPTGRVLIPDGTYEANGGGGSFTIYQNGKETGYVILDDGGIRTILAKPVVVKDNGGTVIIPSGTKFGKLLFNQQIYNQFMKK